MFSALLGNLYGQVASKRFVKRQQMAWRPRHTHNLSQIRTAVLDNQPRSYVERWYRSIAGEEGHRFAGAQPGRATLDVDIGVCVADWSLHDSFKKNLTATGRFEAVPNNPHKLIYHSQNVSHSLPPRKEWPPGAQRVTGGSVYPAAYFCAIGRFRDGPVTSTGMFGLNAKSPPLATGRAPNSVFTTWGWVRRGVSVCAGSLTGAGLCVAQGDLAARVPHQ